MLRAGPERRAAGAKPEQWGCGPESEALRWQRNRGPAPQPSALHPQSHRLHGAPQFIGNHLDNTHAAVVQVHAPDQQSPLVVPLHK